MSRKTIRQVFVLFFCLALAAPLAFGQQPKTPSLDAAQKQVIVDGISTLLNKNYIFPDTAKKLADALRTRLEGGDFDKWNDARALQTSDSA